jgi:predicted O-methyltransferase YrrM
MNQQEFKNIVAKSQKKDLKTEELLSIIPRPKSFLYYNPFIYLAKETNPDLIVELGTKAGAGALSFRLGSPTARIVTVDINSMIQVRKRMLRHNIEPVKSDSTAYADKVEDESVDILFIDANHYWAGALRDFFAWYPKVKKGGIILLDDIYLEGGEKFQDGVKSYMWLAWNCILGWPGTTAFEMPELHPSVNFGVALK